LPRTNGRLTVAADEQKTVAADEKKAMAAVM
jgi:hypothetical protein